MDWSQYKEMQVDHVIIKIVKHFVNVLEEQWWLKWSYSM